MEKGKENHIAHCLILPYPSQGHINPMLQFAKRLRHKQVKITLVVTKFLRKTVQEFPGSSDISLETISDGFDEGGRAKVESSEAYLTRFRLVGTETLSELVEKHKTDCAVDCIIYDPFLSWGLDVAKKFGLVSAAFFTQSCAVDNIYYHVCKKELKLPLSETEKIVIPGLPVLEPSDLPSFVYVHGSYPAAFEMILNQFQNLEKADWILVNTFHKLEEEVINWMAKFLPVKAIGPTVPSMYLDKRLQDDKEYGLSIFKPITDVCMKWLNERASRSVVYVSFGSLAELGAEQMEELAQGLKLSNEYFLWVVRSSEEAKLPNKFSETSKKGLIVSWCPQLEVFAHKAIGCFITHCGWNSTLEALSLGVPMVGMPQWTDQSTNAKFVKNVWKVGVKARQNMKGIVEQTEIISCIKNIMEGDSAEEIRKNAKKWKEFAREAVDEGGSSDKHIENFVSSLINPPTKII
ncbi:UDP-glycosyltransferase 74F2-like [Olea europaea var. sylvestris]|uniref:UDP-glycosyltransferase 74F2-like n=1 Tax=Olea europaea var. sylvestris TaxID=158386 RepID=UPI000C1D05CA|nr:UDP-glycosyltransferase 74F2-like [Olea europaea var. sylvestris]